jgi:crotonobetainyl-CoA:carnitine CoA-transferase CaiB-like acyl-CoA transferase
MKLGESHNTTAVASGRPLDGVRVLALEQYIAMPFVTQFLTRLGADVVKVEPPGSGERARGGLPSAPDAGGRPAGATFWRYNLSKRSVAIDIRKMAGQELVRSLARHFDVVCENLGPDRVQALGLDYKSLLPGNPRLIYLSITGFGTTDSPYRKWPAMAGVGEAMCGAYELARKPGEPPANQPFGAIGDTGAGAIATIGVLAAICQRTRTGRGQYVDISMFDSMLSLCDVVPNYWSLGLRKAPEEALPSPGLISAFRASDGWFTIYSIRRYQFERICTAIERPDLAADDRLATPWDWSRHTEDIIRPAIEAWASSMTKQQAAARLAESGIPSAPCNSQEDVIRDPHVAARRMIVEVPRSDGHGEPVFVPGNPLKMSDMQEGPERRHPTLGEHTDEVLMETLGLSVEAVQALRRDNVIG